MEKVEVNGPNTHPVYSYLRSTKHDLCAKAPAQSGALIPWNFTKWLLNKEGKVIAYLKNTDSVLSLTDEIKR